MLSPNANGRPSENPIPSPAKRVAASTRVVLADPSAGIVVPVETKDPKITMVWIYPAYKPAAQAGASGGE